MGQHITGGDTVDYQTTSSSKNGTTGQTVADSSSNETSLGGGMVLNFTDTIGLTLRYDYGINGKNTTITNAFNFKFAYIW